MENRDKLQFSDPPREYSGLAFWFWNGTLEPEKLKKQIRMMEEQGIYGAFMHARAYLRTPYLEKEWWDAVQACVEEGERIGFHPWLYDEYAWPSGTAGSTFEYGYQKPSVILSKGPQNMAKELEIKVVTSMEALLEAKAADRFLGCYLIEEEALTGEKEKIGQESLEKASTGSVGQQTAVRIFLNEKGELIQEGTQKVLPEELFGDPLCRVYAVSVKVDPVHVDYLNKETIREFIEVTHEQYYVRFGKYFGNVIPGIFFDEIYMSAREFAWTESLPETFKAQHGYDLCENLGWLFVKDAPKANEVREHYYQTISFLYEQAFFKQIADWCEAHGLDLTGHTEEDVAGHPRRQGNYFQTMRHLQLPGADCHDYRYRLPRKISFHESKLSVSVARAYGKKRAMSEAMGGAGWGCSLQEYRRGMHTMAAMGISMYVLHGFYYECEHQGSQADWPASFFYQNPYWKYFKGFADEMRRLCYMNTVGTPVVRIGLYYPIREMQVDSLMGSVTEKGWQISKDYHAVMYDLIENQMDVDIVDEETMLNAPVEDGCLLTGGRRMEVLLFPEEMIHTQDLDAFMEKYEHRGGRILFYGKENPPKQITMQIREVVGTDLEILEGDKSEIYYNHRRTSAADFYFICNSEDEKKELKIKVAVKGGVFRMDPESGERYALYSICEENSTIIPITLEPDQACYLCVERENAKNGENGKREEEIKDKEIIDEKVKDGEKINSREEMKDEEERKGREEKEKIAEMDGKESRKTVMAEKQEKPALKKDAMIKQCGMALEGGSQKPWKKTGYQIITGKWDFLPLNGKYDNSFLDDAVETQIEIPVALFTTEQEPEGRQIRICNTEWEKGRCGRHLSPWKASWITRRPHWQDDLTKKNLYFRKTFALEKKPSEAKICLMCVQEYTLYLNGKKVAEGKGMEPVTLEIGEELQAGENVAAIKVYNPTPNADIHFCSTEELAPDRIISLLAQIRIAGVAEDIITDSSWSVTDKLKQGEEDSWMKEEFSVETQHHDPTHQLTGAPDGAWLYAWERGKPPLHPWGNPRLFGEEISWPVTLHYQITIPVGCAEIKAPKVQGKYLCRLDGILIDLTDKESLKLQPLDRVRILDLEVIAESGEDGLLEPLRVKLVPVQQGYGEWASQGLAWFSGRVIYRNHVVLPSINKEENQKCQEQNKDQDEVQNREQNTADQQGASTEQGQAELRERYVLRLCQKNAYAEFWVNHKLVKICIWEPYEADITEYVKEGDNEIAIVIANQAAPQRHYLLVDEGQALGWDRYWNVDNMDRESEDLVSGLMGPVRIYHYVR